MFSDHICDHIPLEKSSFSWVDFHSLYHPHQCQLLWRSSESPPRTLPHFPPSQFLDFCQTFIFKLWPFKISFFKIFNRRKLFTFNYYISWSLFVVVVVVQLLSRAWLFVMPWTATRQASLSFTISQSLLKFMSIESVMLSNHLILCRPFLLCLQSFPASGSFQMNQFFASSGQSIGASVSASVLPVNIHGWFPLGLTGVISLKFKGLSKSLLQHQNLKASILQHSAFFMARYSHPYMTIGKTMVLTIRTFVSKVMSVLLKALSRFVIAFLSRSKSLLIWWLQSLSAVILEPTKRKSVTASTFSPFICHEVMGLNTIS